METLLGQLTAAQREALAPVPVPLRAGEASIHHSHTVHGSYQNGTDRPRSAVVVNCMHPETRSADGEGPLLRGAPLVPAGEVVQGEYFPLVLCDEPTSTLSR